METPLGKKQITHDRIVDTAARAIRRSGFAGTGVADLMKEAGLTHGGFYAHFASRDALLSEALARAGNDSSARLTKSVAARPARGASALRAFVEHYLSERHLRETDCGCPVAALVSEMPRQSPDVAQAGAQRVRGLIAGVRSVLPPEAADAAGVIAAQLVGALQMARALGDNAEGKRLLAATRGLLLSRYDSDTVH